MEAFKLRSKRYNELGEKMVIVGLFVQIVVVGFLMARSVLVGFPIRLAKSPTAASMEAWVPWQRHFVFLYTTRFRATRRRK